MNEAKKDKRIEGVKKLALEMLDNAIEFIQEKARTHNESALKEVLDASAKTGPEGLQGYIERNKQYSLRVKIAEAFLKGETVSANPEFVMKSLWDCTFDVDVYKTIGENDGILITLNQIFMKLGMHKKAKEACRWCYKFD